MPPGVVSTHLELLPLTWKAEVQLLGIPAVKILNLADTVATRKTGERLARKTGERKCPRARESRPVVHRHGGRDAYLQQPRLDHVCELLVASDQVRCVRLPARCQFPACSSPACLACPGGSGMNSEKPPCWQPMSEPLLLKLINEPGIVRLILKMAFQL